MVSDKLHHTLLRDHLPIDTHTLTKILQVRRGEQTHTIARVLKYRGEHMGG